MDEPKITYTVTIQSVLSELGSEGQIHAADVVKQILEHHQEYASGTAREVASASWPDFDKEEKKTVSEWMEQVRDMFDPLLVVKLHGRLAILGLCRLDQTLDSHLRSFSAEIKKELLEDFDSLLLPKYSGDEKYRRDFLKILQNRAKLSPEPDPEFTPRRNGFLVLTHGGYRLDVLAGLCFQQRYNACLAARYQLFGKTGLSDFLQAMIADLKGVAANDYGTIGSFLPDLDRTTGSVLPDPDRNQRSSSARLGWQGPAQALKKASTLYESDKPVEILSKLHNWSSKVLKTGERLVLFLEWLGLADGETSQAIGLTDEVVDILRSLPERVGIVISGLPESVRREIKSETVYELRLPKEDEPKSGQKLLNDTPDGPDQLNIVHEVRALADAIALKAMAPPLVVGIFGGWGAGKSFVLHLIEQQLQERRCEGIAEGDKGLSDYPFIGHPYLVHFDAWTYAKGNLWASLMQTILVELDRQLSLENELAKGPDFNWRAASPVWKLLWQLSDKQREIFSKTDLGKEALKTANEFAQRGSSGALWTELEKLRGNEKVQLEKEEEALRQLREKQSVARRELEKEVDEELSVEAQSVAWMPVWDELKDLVKGHLDASGVTTFDEMRKAVPVLKKLALGIRNLSLPAAAFMVVAIVGGFIVAQLDIVIDWYAQIGGIIIAMSAPVLRTWEWFEQRRKAYDQRLAIAQHSKDKMRQQRIDESIDIAGENSYGKQVADLERDIDDKAATVERIRSRIGITGHARSLNEFLKTRIDEDLYQKELGLLDQIQNDIQELSDTLLPDRARGIIERKKTDKLFPRGDPRVVLFIDDLDRCPPDKVVEVLEAAQLLVKTHLFVVIIAIDVRYVTRALENEYKGVLVRSGEPSGLDYIEKIIQIPYRVRTVSAPAVRKYLHSQMDINEKTEDESPADEGQRQQPGLQNEPADKADDQAKKARLKASVQAAQTESIRLPTKAIQFEPEEYAVISESCSALAVSPRTMKRLVNVFKLLKIIWYRQGLEDGPVIDVKKAMLSILALCAAYPEVLRKLLAEMEAFYRDTSNDLKKPLVGFLVQRCEEGAKVALYPPDWEQVADALQDENFFPGALTFSRLKEANLHLLSSFSFVGETDAEREATLQRGYYMNSLVTAMGSGNNQADPDSSLPDSSARNPGIDKTNYNEQVNHD